VVSAKGGKVGKMLVYTQKGERGREEIRLDEEIYRSSSHSSSTCRIVGSSEFEDRRELLSEVIDSRLKEFAA